MNALPQNGRRDKAFSSGSIAPVSIMIPTSCLLPTRTQHRGTRTRSLHFTDQLVRPQFLRVQSGLPWWAVDLHLRLLSPSQRAGSRKTDPDIVRNSVDLTVTQMNLDRAGISMRLKIAINNEMMSRSIVLRKVKFDVRLASR